MDKSTANSWCQIQLFHWQKVKPSYIQSIIEFNHLNETKESIFLIEFSYGVVSLVPKPEHLLVRIPEFYKRAKSYLDFFIQLGKNFLNKKFLVAVEVGDGSSVSETAPLFSFQKTTGENCILLPDVNFLEGDFYESLPFTDSLDYAGKKEKAIFTGSTSGMHNSAASVRERQNPRIDAGLFFKDSPFVDFRLPNIVQCDPEGEALIRSLGFGSEGYLSWAEQFSYRFLISMDGNGATCQRLAVALKSNCIVAKYESSSQLYYFPGLIPWYHYVPIGSHQDVLVAMELERANPALFAAIAQNGKSFADEYLSRSAIIDYLDILFRSYLNLFSDLK